jgi:amino acid permease
LFGVSVIIAAGIALICWHGTLAIVICTLLILFGLIFALIPGHGLIRIMACWENVTGRGRKRDKRP